MGESTSHIIPVILGGELETLKCAERLLEKGVIVAPIRPPTVAENSCRLRLSLHAGVSADQAQHLIESFGSL